MHRPGRRTRCEAAATETAPRSVPPTLDTILVGRESPERRAACTVLAAGLVAKRRPRKQHPVASRPIAAESAEPPVPRAVETA